MGELLSGFIGSVMGALVGGFVVWWQTSRELSVRRQERLTDARAEFLAAADAAARANLNYWNSVRFLEERDLDTADEFSRAMFDAFEKLMVCTCRLVILDPKNAAEVQALLDALNERLPQAKDDSESRQAMLEYARNYEKVENQARARIRALCDKFQASAV